MGETPAGPNRGRSVCARGFREEVNLDPCAPLTLPLGTVTDHNETCIQPAAQMYFDPVLWLLS